MSWPSTSPDIWGHAAQAQVHKAAALRDDADALRAVAKRTAATQSGKAVEGFCDARYRDAAKVDKQADTYFNLARGSEEISRLLYGQREDLDALDRDAHQKIEEIRAAAHGPAAQATAESAVWQVVLGAIAAAKALDAKTAGQVTAQAAHMGLTSPPEGIVGGSPGGDESGLDLPPMEPAGFGGGGRPGPGGMPEAPPGLGTPPDGPRPHKGDDRGDGGLENSGPTDDPDARGQGDGTAQAGESGRHGIHLGEKRGLSPDSGAMPMPMPFGGSGGSSSGGGGSSPLSSAGGGLSGFKPPDVSSLSGMGGMGQGMSPGAAGMGTPPAIPPAAASPFSQGLNAGLSGAGAPAAPLAPPVTSALPTTSAAPAGAASAGPASVAAAAGSPVSSPVATPLAAGPATGAGSLGPLPPFGSDVRSAAVGAGTGAAVTPASGSAPPPVSVDRGASAGGGLAVPPGVVGSATGAGAGAATEGVRASLPDPLLEEASRLLRRLLEDTAGSPYSDWCVGIFRTPTGVKTVIVNSDGAGFIPANVFIPRTARMLFTDPGLPQEFRDRWFSWANPAETMVVFADWAGDNAELYALAVSTDQGGSTVPARKAGVVHLDEDDRKSIPPGTAGQQRLLDDDHQHRLETVDPALYARLTGAGDGRHPDQSEAWRTTTTAANAALVRAGTLPDLQVPPVIREILDRIGRGLPISQDSWNGLTQGYLLAEGTAAGLRPGWLGGAEAASPHALAHHNLARLMELLQQWKSDSPDRRDLPYTDIAYLAHHINTTPRISAMA